MVYLGEQEQQRQKALKIIGRTHLPNKKRVLEIITHLLNNQLPFNNDGILRTEWTEDNRDTSNSTAKLTDKIGNEHMLTSQSYRCYGCGIHSDEIDTFELTVTHHGKPQETETYYVCKNCIKKEQTQTF